MANTKSAAKRARQTTKRTENNKRALTLVKTQAKKTRAAITGKDKASAVAQFRALTSALDKAVKTGRLHRNAASRQKSRLNRQLTALA
jgi:small subunit ribosomal protein S20